MTLPFFVFNSTKIGLDSKESYVVVRGRTSYLRVLGAEPRWELMTATASEDHGRIEVCSDQRRLVKAALQLCTELNSKPEFGRDRNGREFVKVGVITREKSESNRDFDHCNNGLFIRFFEIFDRLTANDTRTDDGMRAVYTDLANDGSGDDVYLSDGVWLSQDGSCSDRGR